MTETTIIDCYDCGGSGNCEWCDGSGEDDSGPCDLCFGTGACYVCDGAGTVEGYIVECAKCGDPVETPFPDKRVICDHCLVD